MKKNKMMRLASAMMVMTLMTTSVISGTFAKYVTSDSATDRARVAKWGVTVLASGSLFGANYIPNSALDHKNEISAIAQQSVDADDGIANIVAPGTKSAEGLVLAIAGTPEVAYKVEMESTAANTDIWLAAGEYGVMVDATKYVNADNVTKYYEYDGTKYSFATTYDDSAIYYELHDEANVTENVASSSRYYPVEWTVTDKNGTETKYREVTKVVTALEAIEGATGVPNVAMDDNYTITWEWAFEGQQDPADTILGNLQAAGTNYKVVKLSGLNYVNIENTDYSLNVAFNAKITVTQVD